MKAKLFLLISAGLILTNISHAQDTSWVKTRAFPTEIVYRVSSDPYSNFYVSDERGNIHKYDSTGKKLLVFSPKKNSPVFLLDATCNLNLFVFYQNFQEFKILNRFLVETVQNRLKNEQLGFVRTANLSSDNNLWLIDDTDFSLKKLNFTFNKIEVNTSLELILPPADYNFSYLREYNGFVYIADVNNGILVFDNLGNYKTNIPGIGIQYFSFYNNFIYYLENQHLIVTNLLTGASRTYPLNPELKVMYVLLDKSNAYLFLPAEVQVFQHFITF